MCPYARFVARSAAALFAVGLLAAMAAAEVRLRDAEAVTGGRFGVGRITLSVPRDELPEVLGVDGLGLSERSGRALYPAVYAPELTKLATEILEATPVLGQRSVVPPGVGGIIRSALDRAPRATILFLFQGEAPLELTLRARSALRLRIEPRRDADRHRELLDEWWARYTARPRLLQNEPDYPPFVENYLTTTLARRLSLNLPERKQTESWQDRLREEVGLMLGTEEIRVAMQQDRILGLNNLHLPAELPLPEAPPLEALQYPPAPEGVEIEPIAARVPVECFYVRFGNYANFLWMQDTLERWGGDLRNLLAGRGLSRGIKAKTEEQLVLKQTAMTRLLGPTVVADVAIIGSDLFFRDGAAYGFLFLANSSTVLGGSITGQRTARLAAGRVTEETVTIAGHEVSYLSSPDGRVRSYYAVDGDYHFVCTSRHLVERFFETASGKESLGGSPGLAHARTLMPLSRDDVVFVYLSDEFFRNFTGPHYRIEMARRLQAEADVELVELGTLAAACEGKPAGSIDNLMRAEALPDHFGPRPDGSRAVLEGGEVHDSRRGRRGAMLPVPDVPVGRITKAEQTAYRRFVELYREKWGGRMDPTIVGIGREELSAGRERVVIDAQLSPFLTEHYQTLARWAGPPQNSRLAPVEGDLISGEVVLTSQRIFGGLVDSRVSMDAIGSDLLSIARLRDWLIGYLGTVGEMGLLRLLDVQVPGPADPNGYSRNALGLWRRQVGPYTVFSLHPEVLARVTPQLEYVEAERPAQLWLRVADPTAAEMSGFLNAWGYKRTRETSVGNLRLLHALDQQLHVPPADCREAAEFLLDAKLVCPLGGEYVLRQTPGGERWTSTALEGTESRRLLPSRPPAGYVAPPLTWLRGLTLDAQMTENVLSLHADVVMQPPEQQPAEN